MIRKIRNITFHQKLVLIYSLLFLGATLILGTCCFWLAKKSLDEKGSEILKNAVSQATILIKSEYEHVERGELSEDEAKENIKTLLIGPKNADGTRTIKNDIYLGKYGYFIIYDSKGNEIMHPTLEGKNAWNYKDPKNSSVYIVQKIIKIAKNGGGFMTYHWSLPYEKKVASKVVYCQYFPEWDWIVVSSAYSVEFNSVANTILILMLIIVVIVFLGIVYMFHLYIQKITTPITQVIQGMGLLSEGDYLPLELKTTEREINQLLTGYNQMVANIKHAQDDVVVKTQEISYLAYHDDLTKLLNIYGIKNYVDTSIKHGVKNGALVLIGLNGLSTINAILSYERGNDYIKDNAAFLSEKASQYYCARTRSNEFALWFEMEDMSTLSKTLADMQKDLQEFANTFDFGKSLDYLFAVSYYPKHGADFTELYEKSSIVMRMIKENPGRKIQVYEDYLRSEFADKFLLTLKIASALENGEFVPFYQEKWDSIKNEVVGVEVLARWVDEANNIIGPYAFLPVIIEKNLTQKFTEYMLEHSLGEYYLLTKKYGRDVFISINIFPNVLLSKNIIPMLVRLLDKYNVPANKLVLEITEEVFISKKQEVKRVISTIRLMGIKVSIDDFGTGYSSLKYLTDIEFDELKIDKSFIDRMLSDERVLELIKIFIRIGKVYGYELVAEGVETKEQSTLLESIGVQVIQGYLFSKPEPLVKENT